MAPVATTALLLVPHAAAAEQLEYGVSTSASWNDNVFDQSDFSGRITPFGQLSDPDGELTWSLRYAPSYEQFLDLSEISGFDQDVLGSLSWRFAERWNFSLREAYVSNQSAIRFNETTAPGQEVAIGFRDQEVKSNRTNATLSHLLSPLDSLVWTLNYNALRFQESRRGDPSSASTALSYRHILNERTTAGLTFSWIQQSREHDAVEDDQTYFYNLAGTLEHRFSPTLRLSASAGPTLVDTSPPTELDLFQFPSKNIAIGLMDGVHGPFVFDANDCSFQGVTGRASVNNFEGCSLPLGPIVDGQLPTEVTQDELVAIGKLTAPLQLFDERGRPIDSGATGGNDLTYFANLALIKEWEHWTGSLTYQRSNSDSASFGSSSVADSVFGRLSWTPDQVWTLSFAAGVTKQEQVGEQAVPVYFELVNVPAPAGVTSVDQLAQVQRLVASISSNALEYTTYSASFSANRRLGRRTSAFFSLYWYSQDQKIDTVSLETSRNSHSFRVSVGLRWNFEPIRF
jgi:hypothetical protein